MKLIHIGPIVNIISFNGQYYQSYQSSSSYIYNVSRSLAPTKRNYDCDNNAVDSYTRHRPQGVNYNVFSRMCFRLSGLDLQCADVTNRLLTKLSRFGVVSLILYICFIIYFPPKYELLWLDTRGSYIEGHF